MTVLYLFQQRKLEWCIALATVWIGFFATLPPVNLHPRIFAALLRIMPELGWGLLYLVVGLLHCWALHVDVKAWWTPFVRTVALLLNSQIYLAVAIALALWNPWGLGAQTYLVLGLGFCGVAFRTAAADCGRELAIWQAAKAARKRGHA
jgi:hypothetical protein